MKIRTTRLKVSILLLVLWVGFSTTACAQRSLTDYRTCYDRRTEPYTLVVDAHNHFRPFGGPAVPFTEMNQYLNQTGVLFVNIFGIGQMLPADSTCTYYLDCPGTPVLPTIKNDFVNAANYVEFKPQGVHMVLSMTFPDLSNPENVVEMIHLYDKEYPGLFKWVGELNVVKQAIFKNGHRPVTKEEIDQWAPFMEVLRQRKLPMTLHSDLGDNDNPTKYEPLMAHILERYPDNIIVWAHMGLSKELTTMKAADHIALMSKHLNQSPNLIMDVSWRVLQDYYFNTPDARDQFVAFFNAYSHRILAGTDFVASRNKNFDVYKEELEVNSRVFQYVDDVAFRNIVLGENYFRLLDLDFKAPAVCGCEGPECGP